MASEWVSQKFPLERNVWAWCDIAGSPSTVSSQRKRSCLSGTSAWNGAYVPNPFENSPETWKGKVSQCSRRSGKEIGSELVPAPAGTVRVVHREWVGLRVEYPVFQGERVIFREQKIEIPVPPGGKGSKKPPVSALGTWGTSGNKSQGLRPVAKAAAWSATPNTLTGLVPGKMLWMPRGALSFGTDRPDLILALPRALLPHTQQLHSGAFPTWPCT